MENGEQRQKRSSAVESHSKGVEGIALGNSAKAAYSEVVFNSRTAFLQHD